MDPFAIKKKKICNKIFKVMYKLAKQLSPSNNFLSESKRNNFAQACFQAANLLRQNTISNWTKLY